MDYSINLGLTQKTKQKQTQHLMMSPKMQQAIQFLQLPLMELSQAIDQEIEKNPILEYETEEQEDFVEEKPEPETPEKEIDFDEHQFELLRQLDEDFRDHLAESGPYNPKPTQDDVKLRAYLESSLLSEPTLYDHLMAESREAFSDPEDLAIAEILIGYLDEHGFIKTPLSEIADCFSKKEKDVARVHAVLRTFDPIGIGSRNVQESLLAQLKDQNKSETLTYKLIESHFDDLIHNRLPLLQKKLKISFETLHEIIEELKKLEFHPIASFSSSNAPTLIPDIRLVQNGETFTVEINDFNLKPIRINRTYLRLLDDESIPAETKTFIKEKLISAKWLMKNISARGETLTRIANFIGQYQKDFFASPEGTLTPLIMKSVANELELHESTIARAVSNKFIDTPRGIFPFRHFFSKAYTDTEGNDVSSKTICQLIVELIKNEDKHKPLSDELISGEIQKQGVTCARRTVAKYRTQLKIGNTQQRRQY